MTYWNDPLTQLDGSPAQMHNCGLTVGACLADTWSLGYWKPTPARLRVLSGVPNYSGTTYPQIIAAVSKATGGEVQLRPLYWVPPSALDDALTAKRGVGVMIDCSVTINTPYHTGTYTGLHEIEVVAVRVYNGQKQYDVMDPGKGKSYVKYQWWPAALLIKAAKAATSNGTLLLLTTRDLTNVSRKALSSGHFHSTTVVSSSNESGNIVGGQAYTVLDTAKGNGYPANGHTARGWSKVASNKYAIGTRIR